MIAIVYQRAPPIGVTYQDLPILEIAVDTLVFWVALRALAFLTLRLVRWR